MKPALPLRVTRQEKRNAPAERDAEVTSGIAAPAPDFPDARYAARAIERAKCRETR
jgi:hypothetical protein